MDTNSNKNSLSKECHVVDAKLFILPAIKFTSQCVPTNNIVWKFHHDNVFDNVRVENLSDIGIKSIKNVNIKVIKTHRFNMNGIMPARWSPRAIIYQNNIFVLSKFGNSCWHMDEFVGSSSDNDKIICNKHITWGDIECDPIHAIKNYKDEETLAFFISLLKYNDDNIKINA